MPADPPTTEPLATTRRTAARDAIQAELLALHGELVARRDGEVASYIPELARVDPEPFGLAVVTTTGHLIEAGDARATFTIQSVSKPFVQALVLQTLGRERYLAAVGVEPSGDAFNAIELDEANGRPFNPMVNAGAIASVALVPGASADERFATIKATLEAFAGRSLEVDGAVYRSELATADRNRAIAYLMKSQGMLQGDVETHLDVYVRQCALLVNAADLAVMGATLANAGVNPITGHRALPSELVKDIVSVLFTCGIYDRSGEWAYRVGLPAKSGVGGGLVAVVPGMAGAGGFSPRLDAHGTSVRAGVAFERMAAGLGLHVFATPDERLQLRRLVGYPTDGGGRSAAGDPPTGTGAISTGP
jgi:glutaminase